VFGLPRRSCRDRAAGQAAFLEAASKDSHIDLEQIANSLDKELLPAFCGDGLLTGEETCMPIRITRHETGLPAEQAIAKLGRLGRHEIDVLCTQPFAKQHRLRDSQIDLPIP
jgi:hypothetical protein